MFPPPVKSLQSLTIPWSFIFAKNEIDIVVKRELKKDVNAEDDDIEESCLPSVDKEADIPQTNSEDIREKDDGIGTMVKGEYAELNNDASIVDSEEKIEHNSYVQKIEYDNIKFCDEMDKMERKAGIRGETRNDTHQYANKLDLNAIEEETRNELCGVSGPDDSVTTKLEQLKLHERIFSIDEYKSTIQEKFLIPLSSYD